MGIVRASLAQSPFLPLWYHSTGVGGTCVSVGRTGVGRTGVSVGGSGVDVGLGTLVGRTGVFVGGSDVNVGNGVFVGRGVLVGRNGLLVGNEVFVGSSTGRYVGVLLGILVAVTVGEGVAVGLFILSRKNKIDSGVGSIPVVAVEYDVGNLTKLIEGLAVW